MHLTSVSVVEPALGAFAPGAALATVTEMRYRYVRASRGPTEIQIPARTHRHRYLSIYITISLSFSMYICIITVCPYNFEGWVMQRRGLHVL